MAIDVASLQSFTNAELLKLVDLAIAEIAYYGSVRTVRSKTIQAASLEDLYELKNSLEGKISAQSNGRARNYAKRVRE